MATKEKLPKSFHDLLRAADRPILVDFWAEWCAPCRMLNPVLKQIARDFKDRLLVIKVNVDEKPHIAEEYQIRSIPTLILFERGKPKWRVSGALPYSELKAQLEEQLTTFSN